MDNAAPMGVRKGTSDLLADAGNALEIMPARRVYTR